ncbi:MAG: OPT/YSL family transporter [Acidobacteriia bacterium]|nr:OPT/YSL family transporter [Terriglobia bacterium]
MDPSTSSAPASLPENAYRELAPGETYVPLIPPTSRVPEVTLRSIAFGLAMTVVFSAAAAYIALKLGQGIESAIPIAILAIGFSALLARKSTLLENVNGALIKTNSVIQFSSHLVIHAFVDERHRFCFIFLRCHS